MKRLLMLLLLVSHGTLAQTFPSKPIRVLSTFSSGSPADGMMRLIGQKMGESMGGSVVVEPLPGAGGVVAAQQLIRAPADGHTLLHTTPTALVATPFLVKPAPYDPLKDFTYLTTLADAMTAMVVAGNAPFKSFNEVIAYAKANPGKLAYGSNGVGASYHLEMSLLSKRVGIELIHVPYKGGQGAMTAAVAGQIPVAFSSASSSIAQARSGKVRIVAVMAEKRWDRLPDVPAMGELVAGYEKIPSGNKMVGPAGMPAPLVKRLHAEIVRALKDGEVAALVDKIGFFPVGNSPEAFAAEIRKDMEVMGKGIEAAK